MDKWEKREDEYGTYWMNEQEELCSFSKIITTKQFVFEREMLRNSLDLSGLSEIGPSKIQI